MSQGLAEDYILGIGMILSADILYLPSTISVVTKSISSCVIKLALFSHCFASETAQWLSTNYKLYFLIRDHLVGERTPPSVTYITYYLLVTRIFSCTLIILFLRRDSLRVRVRRDFIALREYSQRNTFSFIKHYYRVAKATADEQAIYSWTEDDLVRGWLLSVSTSGVRTSLTVQLNYT